MQAEYEIVIADTTCFILLDKIGEFTLLKSLFGKLAAERMHLNYTGTFGLILRAKQNGIIPSVASIIAKIQNTNFHYSQSVINDILRLAGED